MRRMVQSEDSRNRNRCTILLSDKIRSPTTTRSSTCPKCQISCPAQRQLSMPLLWSETADHNSRDRSCCTRVDWRDGRRREPRRCVLRMQFRERREAFMNCRKHTAEPLYTIVFKAKGQGYKQVPGRAYCRRCDLIYEVQPLMVTK